MTPSEIILETICSSAAASLAVAWLFRAWIGARLKEAIKSEYDLKLEAAKADLKRENDVYMEQLKAKYDEAKQLQAHSLELARMERQIKFSGSYQEVLKATAEVHAKLVELQVAVQQYTSILEMAGMGSKEERREKVGKLLSEFWVLFNAKRIYFPEKLDKEITACVKEVQDAGIDFMMSVEQRGGERLDAQKWLAINEKVSGMWNGALASIREQFRSTLGIDEPVAK